MQFHNKIEKQNALFSVGLFSTIKINKKKKQNKTKQPYPYPFLKTKQKYALLHVYYITRNW